MIKWSIIILFVLIGLGYIGFDIRRAVEAPATQSNIEYAGKAISFVWNKYLEEPVKYVFNKVVINYIWEPIVENIKK